MYPIFFHTTANNDWPELEVGKWYFYDETGASAEGPFNTRPDAEVALETYCRRLSAECRTGSCDS